MQNYVIFFKSFLLNLQNKLTIKKEILKITKIEDAEACADGNIGKDIFFDKPITQDFAEYLGKLGKYMFFKDLPKPYAKVIVRGYYTLKCSLGNDSMQILVPETILEEIINDLENYIDKYIDK